jgi:threonyl-tRNA synthetase
MIHITLPDGSVRTYPKGASAMDVALSISEGLARNVLSAKVNGEVWDATRPIHQNASLQLLTWDNPEGKNTFWHSSAHLMAEALEALYPGIKFGIGPPVDNGFYYDVDPGDRQISSDDFKLIEQTRCRNWPAEKQLRAPRGIKADAVQYFTEKGDEYKLELIEGPRRRADHLLRAGQFRGPLQRAAHPRYRAHQGGKADERCRRLLARRREAQAADAHLRHHLPQTKGTRRVPGHAGGGQKTRPPQAGRRSWSCSCSPKKWGRGLPIWLPKGTALRTRMEDFLKKEQIKRGYTP